MRNFINIVEGAGIHLPSPTEVFPDEEVSLIFDQGFDVGKRYGSNGSSERDEDSIHDLLDAALENGEYEEGSEFEFVEGWLRGVRYDFVTSELLDNLQMKNGLLVVKRHIVIDKKTLESLMNDSTIGLGEFWSFGRPSSHWHPQGGDDLVDVYFTALVNPDVVDWIITIRRLANYSLGDEEEITLRHGTPLRLIEVEANSKTITITNQDRIA